MKNITIIDWMKLTMKFYIAITILPNPEKKTKVFDAGPCYVSIDGTLNKIGVERKKYFGGCFVGNDCHKILRDDNLSLLCDSLPITVNEKTFSGDVYDFAVENCEKFKILFSKFS